MDKKLSIPNLDESYCDGIGRIVGSKNDATFLLPASVLKKRKEYWHDFFQKYTEQSIIENDLDLLDTHDSGPHKKSLKFIQHWVDNGTLPYKSTMDVDKQTKQCDKEEMLTNSSSSSVDTVAYILSNNNTTNKVATMAIVEGAKQGSLVNLENEDAESIDTSKLVTSTDGQVNNDNVLQQNEESSIENDSIIASAEIRKDVTFNRYDESGINRTPKRNYNNQFAQKLMHFITKKDRNSYIKRNLLNRKLNQSPRIYLAEENSECQNDSKQLSQRKKLYSARDSPVDIVSTLRRSTSLMPRIKQFLHPALHSETIARRGSKFLKRRRTKQISMYHKHVMNNSILYLPNETIRKKRNNTRNTSKGSSQSVRKLKTQKTSFSSIDANSTAIECNNQNISMSAVVNTGSEVESEPNNTGREFRDSKLTVSKPNELNKVTISQNLKPIVCLKQLSESDIRKYKTPKNLAINFDNLLRPTVRLERLPKSVLKKYKNSDEIVKDVKNTYSAIYLEQSSQFVSDESRKVEKMVRIPCNLNGIVRLTRLTKGDIENSINSSTLKEGYINSSTFKKDNINSNTIEKNNILSTFKNNDLQSQTSQIQNHKTSNIKKTLPSQNGSTNSFCNNRTINLFEDSDSDHSTLLSHECDNSKSTRAISNLHNSSNVSLYNKIGIASNKIHENNASVTLNGEIETSSKNNYKHAGESDHKKNSFIFLVEDSNDFVKLIPRKKKKTFKNSINTDPNDADDNCSIAKLTVMSENTSPLSRRSAENKARRWNFRQPVMSRNVHKMSLRNKKDRFTQRVTTDCNDDENNVQTAIRKPERVNVKKAKDKLDMHNLYFRTRLFDTDSEASSL